jgi:16S rRNA processing protein RimM
VDAGPGTRREKVLIGRISGAHGIKGWVKIHSDTEPRDAIFGYQPWLIGTSDAPRFVITGRNQGKHLVAELEGVSDRDAAEGLAGQDITVFRDQLPELPQDRYYWTDLVGLQVINQEGVELGVIKSLLATGANDVMVVSGDRERLIPFIRGSFVSQVDLQKRTVKVNWDADF